MDENKFANVQLDGQAHTLAAEAVVTSLKFKSANLQDVQGIIAVTEVNRR